MREVSECVGTLQNHITSLLLRNDSMLEAISGLELRFLEMESRMKESHQNDIGVLTMKISELGFKMHEVKSILSDAKSSAPSSLESSACRTLPQPPNAPQWNGVSRTTGPDPLVRAPVATPVLIICNNSTDSSKSQQVPETENSIDCGQMDIGASSSSTLHKEAFHEGLSPPLRTSHDHAICSNSAGDINQAQAEPHIERTGLSVATSPDALDPDKAVKPPPGNERKSSFVRISQDAPRRNTDASVDFVMDDDTAAKFQGHTSKVLKWAASVLGLGGVDKGMDGKARPAEEIYLRADMDPKTPAGCGCFAPPGSAAAAALRRALGRWLGIMDPDVWRGDRGSRLIHPDSTFCAGVEMLMAILLLYCTCILPIQLSLWDGVSACQSVPTQSFDMMVDLIFVLEVMLRFFIGIDYKGVYYDSFASVAWLYLTSPTRFCFDILTSLPISWADYFIMKACLSAEEDESGGSAAENLGLLRVVKILRVVKMGRLFRMFRIFRVVSERLDLTPSNLRLFRLLFTLGSVMHLSACFWWRVKLDTNTTEELEDWMSKYAINPGDNSNIYVTCFYFIATVCFTVGFGDISASNFGERIFCIFLMSCAACVFGLILGELQEIYAAANTKTRELDDHMESVVEFLKQNKVPKDVERRIKSFVRFQFPQLRADNQNREIMDMLPSELRETLACNINKALFSKVVLWSKMPKSGNVKDQFTADLLLRMQSCFYVAGSMIASCKEEADRLMVIVSGSVSIYEHNRCLSDQSPPLLVIGPGNSIGDNSILGDPRWAGHYGIDANYIAERDCKICYFLTEEIQEVAKAHPSYFQIRRLFEGLRFQPDDVLPAPLAEDEIDAAERSAMLEYQPRKLFHWIRLARTLLHTEPPLREGELEPGLAAVLSGERLGGIFRLFSRRPRNS